MMLFYTLCAHGHKTEKVAGSGLEVPACIYGPVSSFS